MNENAKRWIEALRSGRYGQTRDRLKSLGEFCCLGVACEISGLADWGDDDSYLGAVHTLPERVCDWLGVKCWDPTIYIDGYTLSLSFMNDRRWLGFDEIADLIETHAGEIFLQKGGS